MSIDRNKMMKNCVFFVCVLIAVPISNSFAHGNHLTQTQWKQLNDFFFSQTQALTFAAQCPPNENWDCGPACQITCRNFGQICPMINMACTNACYCNRGWARDDRGACIPANSNDCINLRTWTLRLKSVQWTIAANHFIFFVCIDIYQ